MVGRLEGAFAPDWRGAGGVGGGRLARAIFLGGGGGSAGGVVPGTVACGRGAWLRGNVHPPHMRTIGPLRSRAMSVSGRVGRFPELASNTRSFGLQRSGEGAFTPNFIPPNFGPGSSKSRIWCATG